MGSILPRRSSDPVTRRQARLVGLASIPLVVYSYVQPGELTWLPFWPVFGAGLVAGYVAMCRGESGSGAGFDAGEVGAVPGLWTLLDVFVFSGDLRADPLGVGALVALLTPIIILLGGLSGAVGGRLGGWLAEVNGHPEQPVEAS
ncbi:DUF5518 domain-containing protein [Haloarcula salinisoli]|uniref:DUF5518 domain-containing protein n=1 Tax=Haloarcula salinisoli TaxID=2487746 RepID=A0A8J7Y9X5_9EURY|nr:DUF5518 domain-containing protein [Halomicroarcula salinisoli]MBX0286436.1 DUF5518 domain-containing protein [Halomicroarcula salinisoli]MBX0302075.1 DUF5518 domain-containing protein [Halomicroarcula salinisoli]